MKLPLFIIGLILLCAVTAAVPVTNPATLVGNNNVTLNGNGVVGNEGWFQWGMKTGFIYAHLPNVTPVGGVITYTVQGTPLFGETQYFYKACDPSGCGAEVSFTTTAVTPIPIPAYGAYAVNMTESAVRGDIPTMLWDATKAYTTLAGDAGETVFFGLIFAMIFVGMWLRTRGTATATTYGMICLSLFGVSGAMLGGGVLPSEFLAAGQALMYLSLTGAILAFTFK